jgi:hypothetical protein
MENKFMSLEWFKNSTERAIEKVVANKLESLIEQDSQKEKQESLEKAFTNVKLVNDTLIVVLTNGKVLIKPEATEEDYYRVLASKTIDDVINVISSIKVTDERMADEAEYKRMQALKKGIKLLADLEDFTVEGNSVFLTGTSRSLPQLLVEKFIEVVDRVGEELDYPWEVQVKLNQDEEYLSLKRFFMWCCLNPRAEVANELYRFLTENSFKITKQGFFVALRNVVTLHGSPELVHFISNAYNKVKAVWKKNPDHYTVFLEDGEYKLVHDSALVTIHKITSDDCPECNGAGGWYNEDCEEYSEYSEDDSDECWEDCENCNGTGVVEEYTYTVDVPVDHGQRIGGLTELYLDLPNREENRFTDNWSKTFDIRIGQVVSMPKEECNWSTQDCATAGLHFAGYTAPYVLCGDTTVMTLHNPMKVVGIGTEKGRCWEYLPFMLTTVAEADQIMNDRSFDFLQLDEQYAIRELESLAEKAKEGFAAESTKYEFNLPTLSSVELRAIVASLDEIKNEISKRIVTID